jgi:choice-of-anchor B domain-containing protein
MRKFLLCIFAINAVAYAQTNITFVGRLDYQALHGANLSNLWGYTDETGVEYAIVGAENGVSVVSLSDPSNPTEIFFEPGTNSMWREVKTFGDYAYITTEETDGMMIIDLSPLPGSTTLPVNYFFGAPGNQFQTAHSLFIDENGILYLHGSDIGNGGVIFYDLNTSATNPDEVGTFDDYYIHDSYARGDTLYAGHILDGFFTIVDVSDKMNPVILGSQNTPHNFTHNTWLSDNGQFLFTTDEVSGAFIGAYDVSDPTDIIEVDRIQHDPGTGVIPHNTYYLNGYVITSYYRNGVTIHDVMNPSMMVEVGNYDTSPLAGDGFNGAWGVYPYFPSGNLIISDMEEGLFVLAPNYQRGCYLNGTVTDASNSQVISGAKIEILLQNITDYTNGLGFYGNGILTPGNYNIVYSKPGYYPDTIFNLALNTSVITTQDVQLTPLPVFTFSGHVQDNNTLIGIPGTTVEIKNEFYTYNATTDSNGDFFIPSFFDEAGATYDFSCGKWGYVTNCSMGNEFNSTNSSITVGLDQGIYDDFTFDYGWTVSGEAPRGIWERAVPIGTVQGGVYINANEDVNSDCGKYAFVTGNAGGSAGSDDLDSAATILTSPVFDLSTYVDPYVHYSRWFVNKFANNQPNDTLQFFLDNGITTVRIEFSVQSNTSQSMWINRTFQITDFITPTSNMRMIVKMADWQADGGNLAEGGFDNFEITEGMNSITEISATKQTLVYPNPNDGNFKLTSTENMKSITLYDFTGRIILSENISGNEYDFRNTRNLSDGIYHLRIELINGSFETQKIIHKR